MRNIPDICYDYATKKVRTMNWHRTRHSTRFMKQHFQGRSVIGAEIGVFRGGNTINILHSLNVEKIYLIDPYSMYDGNDSGEPELTYDELFDLANYNLRKFKGKFKFIRKKSSDAVDDIPDGLDFVEVDGNHLLKYVKQDIELYYPKIRVGGVLCGHDFDLPDVAQAVIEFRKKKNLKLSSMGYPVCWWMVKR